MERTEAAVAEILGEAAALNLSKFHFTKPHLSLTAVQIRVLLLLLFVVSPFRVVLASKVNPSGFRQVPPLSGSPY